MKRKIVFVLVSLVLCACSTKITFRDYVEEFVEKDDTILEIDEIITTIDFDDAKFGISIIKNKNNEAILYLSSMLIDENQDIEFDYHGNHIPLSFYREDNKRIWTWYNLKNDIFKYEEDETSNHKYIYGILDGKKNSLTYNNKDVKKKVIEFNYMKEKVYITFWIIQLENGEVFSLDKLK